MYLYVQVYVCARIFRGHICACVYVRLSINEYTYICNVPCSKLTNFLVSIPRELSKRHDTPFAVHIHIRIHTPYY